MTVVAISLLWQGGAFKEFTTNYFTQLPAPLPTMHTPDSVEVKNNDDASKT